MDELSVGNRLKTNYEDYYADADAEWRRLGAIGKADNILALCGDLPCDTVLEIGAGEGSLLRRLSELGFGKSLYALEISSSGVAAIKQRAVLEHLEHPRQLPYEAARVSKRVFVCASHHASHRGCFATIIRWSVGKQTRSDRCASWSPAALGLSGKTCCFA
jgi:tRNA G46 methylase TrmB